MKHFLLACSLIVAAGMSAQTFQVDDINYKVIDADALTVSVEKKTPSYTGDVVIPSTVTSDGTTYTVVALTQSATASTTDGAFANCSGMTSITLPETLTQVGNYTFNGCSGLTTLTIPESVTTFGTGAFQNCTGLTELTMPKTAETLGDNLFKGCSKLETLAIPDGITTLSKNDIQSMGALLTVSLPATLTAIGDGNFQACAKIETITIPEGVATIGANFAYNCGALTSVELPSTLTAIGNYAFWSSKVITTITCNAATPPALSTSAFYGWDKAGTYETCTLCVPKDAVEAYKAADIWKNFTNIEAILAPAAEVGTMFTEGGITYIVRENADRLAVAVTMLEDESGEGLTYSGSVTVPETVTYNDRDYTVTEIGVGAFYSCKELTSVTLPATIELIGQYAFSRCESLADLSELPAALKQIDPHAFAYTALKDITVSAENSSFAAENAILYALDDNGTRTKVIVCAPGTVGDKTVTEGVTEIEYGAFANCDQVSAINLPSTLTAIGAYAFDNCLRVYSLTIPESVTGIGAQAFYKCEYLSSLTLPSKLDEINEGLFMFCRSLPSLELPATIGSIGAYAFEACTSLSTLTVPDGCTFIGSHAFEGCTGLKTISLAETVATIDEFAFIGCTGLEAITLPKEMETIGYGAFKDCITVKEINMPEKLASLGGYAFCHCDQLTSIELPEGLTELPERVFWECNKLTDVKIPTSVTVIGEYAFSNAGITDIELHEGVTTIAAYAFQKCASLKTISIPSTVTTIGDYAFWNCKSAQSFISLATVPPTATKAFSSGFPVSTCHLYVPAESIGAYREADGWSKFTSIEDLGAAGIGEIASDLLIELNTAVYDLNGRCVAKGALPTAPGIYVVKGRKLIVR